MAFPFEPEVAQLEAVLHEQVEAFSASCTSLQLLTVHHSELNRPMMRHDTHQSNQSDVILRSCILGDTEPHHITVFVPSNTLAKKFFWRVWLADREVIPEMWSIAEMFVQQGEVFGWVEWFQYHMIARKHHMLWKASEFCLGFLQTNLIVFHH